MIKPPMQCRVGNIQAYAEPLSSCPRRLFFCFCFCVFSLFFCFFFGFRFSFCFHFAVLHGLPALGSAQPWASPIVVSPFSLSLDCSFSHLAILIGNIDAENNGSCDDDDVLPLLPLDLWIRLHCRHQEHTRSKQ